MGRGSRPRQRRRIERSGTAGTFSASAPSSLYASPADASGDAGDGVRAAQQPLREALVRRPMALASLPPPKSVTRGGSWIWIPPSWPLWRPSPQEAAASGPSRGRGPHLLKAPGRQRSIDGAGDQARAPSTLSAVRERPGMRMPERSLRDLGGWSWSCVRVAYMAWRRVWREGAGIGSLAHPPSEQGIVRMRDDSRKGGKVRSEVRVVTGAP